MSVERHQTIRRSIFSVPRTWDTGLHSASSIVVSLRSPPDSTFCGDARRSRNILTPPVCVLFRCRAERSPPQRLLAFSFLYVPQWYRVYIPQQTNCVELLHMLPDCSAAPSKATPRYFDVVVDLHLFTHDLRLASVVPCQHIVSRMVGQERCVPHRRRPFAFRRAGLLPD